MKKLAFIATALAAIVTASCASVSTHTKAVDARRVLADIEAQEYTIMVDRAIPARGRTFNLTSSYSVRINGDSVFSYLPYFGRAYSLPYGGGEGLIFDVPIRKYQLQFDKKGVANIDFEAVTREDTYNYSITIYSDGTSNVYVRPNNKQPISFDGRMEP